MFNRFFATKLKSFEDAKNALNDLKDEPDNVVKLQIYGLFKQATKGKCSDPEPSAINFVKKAKWDAWNELGELSKTDAEEKYIDLIQKLLDEEQA
ncbi:Enoyl-CoA delta isomerase 2, mitochondrial [Cichlidogyrus casuarinus]|uniref:Enoyl-CoA delta isomerase 2, mitochondrial n=1 Tax=Cichlidogyrus casuarinus TaxID=1844966 RepID=A0ABD2Q769_9PLAT